MDQQDGLKVTIRESVKAGSNKVTDYMFKDRPTKMRLSRPLLGLPLRRYIPQGVHSLLDYANGLTLAASAGVTNDRAACWAGATLGAMLIGVSAVTDYRLSLAKWIPIEVHEASDYVGGLATVIAPFALGYHKRCKAAKWMHIGVGLGMLAVSLFTNYRAYKGVTLRQ